MPGTDVDRPTGNVLDLLQDPKVHQQLERALKPSGIATDYFVRVLQTEVRKSDLLQKCSPDSFLGAMMTSAELGLRIGLLGEAYLIPRKGEAQFQAGYQGWMKLARNAGGRIACGVVYNGDEFDFELGTAPFVHHKPDLEGDHSHKNIRAVWAQVESASGERILAVMGRADVERHRDRYAQKVNGRFNQPWLMDSEGGNFDQMALKTVIIRAVKFAPKSTEMERAYEAELQAEPAFDVEGEAVEETPAEPVPLVNKAQTDAIEKQLARTGVDWVGVQNYLEGQRARARSQAPVPETMDQMTRDEGKEVLAVLKDMSDAPAMPGETKSAGHETTAADPETTPADSETVEPEVVEGEIVDDEIADEAAGRRTRRIDAISALIAEGPLPRAYVSTMLERQFGKTINQMDDAELDSFIAWYGDEAKKISGEG